MIHCYDSVRIQYSATYQLLRWQWHGYTTAHFQGVFDELLTFTSQNRVKCWLADTSTMPAIGIDEQEWLSQVWLPRLTRSYLQRLALVLPLDLHNQLVIESVLNDSQRYAPIGCNIQFFSDNISALDWLTSSADDMHHLESEWESGQHVYAPEHSFAFAVRN